jgi:hypothetical protein
MSERFSAPRLIAAAIVLLLHLLVVAALLKIGIQSRPPRQSAARPVLVWLTLPQARQHQREEAPIAEPRMIAPEQIAPPPEITVAPPGEPSLPQSEYGGIAGVGRYLNNCSGEAYEKLSAREKTECLGDMRDARARLPLLGPAVPSPFDSVLQKRNAPFIPMEHPCPVGKPGSNHQDHPCYFGQ